jgi:hypothetical protein
MKKRVRRRKSAGKRPTRRSARPRTVPFRRPHETSTAEQVVLRTSTQALALQTAAPDVNLARAAMQWTYIVRSRQRWSAASAAMERQSSSAADLLRNLGIAPADLRSVALAGMVEVSTIWSGVDDRGWASRILPWEYVIAGATRAIRNGLPLTIVRHLNVNRGHRPKSPIKRVLFVVSEPGPLQGHFSYKTERELVRDSLNIDGSHWSELDSPTAESLRSTIGDFKPDIVHLAGFDTHLARTILLQTDKEAAAHLEEQLARRRGADEIGDGYILAGSDGLHPLQAEELSGLLSTENHHPRLVAFNIGNSAARIAPHAVAHGADAAIGFQDNFNDQLAEFFFSVLYSNIRRLNGDVINAFRLAWERVRLQPGHRQGTGVVLWNAHSVFEIPRAPRAKGSRQATVSSPPLLEVEAGIAPADVLAGESDKWLAVDVKAREDLNYSMLHNQRPLFDHFVIHCRQSRTFRNVQIKVSLSTGVDSSSFECALDLTPPSVDLNPLVHVPLTSAITRSVHESLRTSLLVEVVWGNHILYRDTKRVRLTPVDQWRDNETDRIWLPSFIFPRDSTITRLVDTAQRYVRVLRDDPAAGFDGYQSFDSTRPDPASEVDLQVQAVWSAIVHELRLGYINPPPGYSSDLDSQRLRTPSMVARDHAGTCIDLALFFAACLELIDIYPVIFLLEGHAFPGYWRASDYHDEFKVARPDEIQNIVRADSKVTGVYGAQREPWFLGKPTYREIVQLVNSGKLVAIETVRLTENCGFWEAIDSGRENLRVQREFEAMVDVALAREKQVTPLPILGEQV